MVFSSGIHGWSTWNNKGRTWENPDAIINYDYSEAYEIETTPEQDKTIADTFTKIAKEEEYDLTSNNCAHAVQRSLLEGKVLPPVITQTISPTSTGYTFEIQRPYTLIPQPYSAYSTIKLHNPMGLKSKKRNKLRGLLSSVRLPKGRRMLIQYFIWLFVVFTLSLIAPVYELSEEYESRKFFAFPFVMIILLLIGLFVFGICLYVVCYERLGKYVFWICLINYVLLYVTLCIIQFIMF